MIKFTLKHFHYHKINYKDIDNILIFGIKTPCLSESLFQYKYNKYSLSQKYIEKHVGLAVQNKELLICCNGKIEYFTFKIE